MAKHLKTGEWGERMARSYLEGAGFLILETNWRYRRSEVDIIAREGATLVFVEVKTRRSAHFGQPEAFVTSRKEEMMADAAAAYMEQTGHDWEIRFDIISIVGTSEAAYELQHFRDAFWPGIW